MAYCTLDDLTKEFGLDEMVELSDRDGDGSPDQDVIDHAVSRASAEIDGYLAGNYVTPLTNVDEIIVAAACDISRYYLYDAEIPDLVVNRYKRAVEIMREIQSGKRRLKQAESPSDSGVIVAGSKRPTFGADTWAKYPGASQ